MIESNDKILDYNLYQKFMDTYVSTGYEGIDRKDPLILDLEEMTRINDQYFFIANLLQGKIIFTSKRSMDMIGVDAEVLNPFHNINAIHPAELYRNTKGWGKLLNIAGNLLMHKENPSLLSVNMKMLNPKGTYSEILYQCFMFYSRTPMETIYELQIHTNIDSFPKRKNGYHYYVGKELNNFRYPDEELLKKGPPFSFREYEIITLIEKGLSSQQIAENLFLSSNTVNTHRCNILKKSNKRKISDLIYELKEQGIL